MSDKNKKMNALRFSIDYWQSVSLSPYAISDFRDISRVILVYYPLAELKSACNLDFLVETKTALNRSKCVNFLFTKYREVFVEVTYFLLVSSKLQSDFQIREHS